jgi:hypothetical protein
MRRFGTGTTAVLLGALLAGAAAAQPPGGRYTPTPAFGSGWWDEWFGGKPRPLDETDKKPAPPGKGEAPAVPLDRGKEQERHMNAYLRRLEVCDRLKAIAQDTNDAALAEEAERLNDLAWMAYVRHAAPGLGGAALPGGAAPARGTLSGEGRGAGGPAARTASVREGGR